MSLAIRSSRTFGCPWTGSSRLGLAEPAAAGDLTSRPETRWPEFVRRAHEFEISDHNARPLTAGDNRLGAFGFSSVAPYEPSPTELEFLERVANEFAVAVECLPRQAESRPGAGPAANAVRHHECACIKAISRRIISCNIRPAFQGRRSRSRGADACATRRPELSMCMRCILQIRSFLESVQGAVQPCGHARRGGARYR